MRNSTFTDIARELAQAEAQRENIRMRAFELLEVNANTLASLALHTLGDRARAARWMSIRQRRLDGRSAYEALAEGDVDRVWDLVIGEGT